MPHPDHFYGLLNEPDPGPPWPPTRLPPSLIAAADEWSRTQAPVDPLVQQQYMRQQAAMAGEPGYASIAPTPSRGSRILDHIRYTLPRMVSDFGKGVGRETPRGVLDLARTLGAESVGGPGGWITDIIDSPYAPRAPDTAAGRAGGMGGMLTSEVVGGLAADAAAAVRGVRELRDPEGSRAVGSLELASAVPAFGLLATGPLRAARAKRGLEAMPRSRLEGAIADVMPAEGTGQEWMNLLYRQERTNPMPKKMLDPTTYPFDDPRGHEFTPRSRTFAQGEGEWTGIQGLLSENPDRVFTRDELLRHMEERGVKLKETWRGADEVQKVMNQESQYLGPEVRRVMETDPGYGPEGVDPYDLVLSNDAAAYEEIMGKFPELIENEDWAEIVLGDVFPNRRIYGPYADWDSGRFEVAIRETEQRAQRYQAEGDTEEAARLFRESEDMTLAWEASEGSGAVPAPKFESYRIEGPSENYRELTIELDDTPRLSNQAELEAELSRLRREVDDMTRAPENMELGAVRTERLDRMNEIQSILDGRLDNYDPARNRFTQGHYDEPNVLVHLRMSDRTYVNPDTGKTEKVLLLEEIQSDWHEKGRKYGYASGAEKAAAAQEVEDAYEAFNELRDRHGTTHREVLEKIGDDPLSTPPFAWKPTSGDDSVYRLGYGEGPEIGYEELFRISQEFSRAADRTKSAQLALRELERGMPPGPYTPTGEWTELALRRAIQEAVDGGYDRVAWASGEQAAELYDLRKHIESLSYNEATGTLEAWNLDGARVIDESGITPEQLPEYIGKEPAQRLMDADVGDEYVITEKTYAGTGEPFFEIAGHDAVTERGTREAAEQAAKEYSGTRHLTGEDLTVGGKGMIGYYDRIVPRTARKYGKQVGGIEIESIAIGAEVPRPDEWYVGYRDAADEGPFFAREDAQEWLDSHPGGKYDEGMIGNYATDDLDAAMSTNSSFAVTPEMRRIVGEGDQRLWSAGGIGLLGAGAAARQRDDEPGPISGLLGPPRR